MKTLLLFLFASTTLLANDEFELKTTDIPAAFQSLSGIEARISGGEDLTISQIEAEYPAFKGNLEMNNADATIASDKMPILGAFWWGCALSVVGLILVYFITDNDRSQVKSALIGCVIGTLVFGSLGGILGGWF